MSSAAISFDHICFGYSGGRENVLDDFTADIKAGTPTVILGPNGVGKTTLLYLLLGWLHPDSGTVTLANRDIGEYTQRERGQLMSLVPQKEHIPFEYSLIEYVLLGRIPHLKPLQQPGNHDLRVATQALETVGLYDGYHRSISQLSGGERQLLLIARALTQQPRMLLLDEPTSHLDLKNKRIVIDILKQLVTEGLTVILTTHEPEVALAIGEYGIFMRDGKVLRHGALNEIFTGTLLSETYGSRIEVSTVGSRKVAHWV
jgi:iron complex transport system ATP-binding protein